MLMICLPAVYQTIQAATPSPTMPFNPGGCGCYCNFEHCSGGGRCDSYCQACSSYDCTIANCGSCPTPAPTPAPVPKTAPCYCYHCNGDACALPLSTANTSCSQAALVGGCYIGSGSSPLVSCGNTSAPMAVQNSRCYAVAADPTNSSFIVRYIKKLGYNASYCNHCVPEPATRAGLSAGDDVGIAIAVLVLVFAAGFVARGTQRRLANKGPSIQTLSQPLLERADQPWMHATQLQLQELPSVAPPALADDAPADATPRNNNNNNNDAPADTTLSAPRYNVHTGFAENAAAEAAIAQCWASDSSTADVEQMSFRVSYGTLASATGRFSESFRIGGGGSCAVYRGRVYGVWVAIKSIKVADQEGAKQAQHRTKSLDEKQFTAEMRLLQAVRHPNICRLLAISSDGPRRCLVLPLCAGGALSTRLKSQREIMEQADGERVEAVAAVFTWQQRLQVAVAIGRALVYLHSLTPPMVHRDVKTQNVLLTVPDAEHHSNIDMVTVTKIADFGTVRADVRLKKDDSLPTENHNIMTHGNTHVVIGTGPYMPFEYAQMGQVSEKTDAFAFGICLIELLSGLGGYQSRELLMTTGIEATTLATRQDIRALHWPTEILVEFIQIAEHLTDDKVQRRATISAVLPQLMKMNALS